MKEKVYSIKRKKDGIWETENILYKFEINSEDLYDLLLDYFNYLFTLYDNSLIRYEIIGLKTHKPVLYNYIRSKNNLDEILAELLDNYSEINFYDVSDDKSMHDEIGC